MITWQPAERPRLLGRFMLSTHKNFNRNDVAKVIVEIKTRMFEEPDQYKQQCWAEVGLEMNRIFMLL